jgi:osmotically-inducible protein OsmY
MGEVNGRSDAEIEGDVRQALAWDNRVHPGEIAVTVLRGTVTLVGTVDSLFKRWAAQEVAGAIPGVLGVANEIEVRLPSADERNDVDLTLAVARALALDPTLVERGITVVVSRAQVTLQGDVESAEEQAAAERIASQVFGVRAVMNAVYVRPQVETGAPAPTLHR